MFPASHVVAQLAVTLDGKIDTEQQRGAGFSSRADRDRVDAFRAEADVLVVGAGTVRAEDPPLRVLSGARRDRRCREGRAGELVVVVLSRGGGVPPEARFLHEPAAARYLALPQQAGGAALDRLAPLLAAGRLDLLRAPAAEVEPGWLLAQLAQLGLRRVLVEGGGQVVAAFLDAGLLDELRLTLCPLIAGGRDSPALYEGAARTAQNLHRLRLDSVEREADEVVLRYLRSPAPAGP